MCIKQRGGGEPEGRGYCTCILERLNVSSEILAIYTLTVIFFFYPFL